MDDYYAKIDAYMSQEKRDSLMLDHSPVQFAERKKSADEGHHLNGDVFALEYGRKLGQNHHQTQPRSPSEDGDMMDDEESSSEVPSSSSVSSVTSSPVPSESTGITISNSVSPGDPDEEIHSISPTAATVQPHARNTTKSAVNNPRHLSAMNDGSVDTSGYTSNNSSKDEEPHSHSAASSSVRSDSPDSPAPPPPALAVIPLGLVNRLVQRTTHLATTTTAAAAGPATVPPTRLSGETPIERDIRLATLRDNEFRLQQGLGPRRTSDDIDPAVLAKKLVKTVPAVYDHQHYTNTQRIMATTRLQQEIEEQKRRELDLKRDGRVQSISEERMDSTDDMLTIHPDTVANTLDHHQHQHQAAHHDTLTPQSSNSSSVDPALQSATIKEQRAFFETATLLPPPITIAHVEKAPLTKTWSSTPVTPKTPVTPMRMIGGSASNNMIIPVSMEKFFSTRGKAAANGFRSTSPLTPAVNNSHFFDNGAFENYVDFSAVRKTVSVGTDEVDGAAAAAGDTVMTTKKVYRTAKTKISEELREMEEREAELREARITLGLISDEAPLDDDRELEEPDVRHENAHSETLLEISQIPKGHSSILLAQWEARAHQDN